MEIVFKAGQSFRHLNDKALMSNYSSCSVGEGGRHSSIMPVLIETMRMHLFGIRAINFHGACNHLCIS